MVRTVQPSTNDTKESPERPLADAPWAKEARVFSGLTLRVYDMPAAVDRYVQPLQPALSVGLLLNGALHLGVRQTARRWTDHQVHAADLFVRPPNGEPRELRWRTRDPQQTQMLNVYLHHEFLFRVVAEVAERDPTRITFAEYNGFHDPVLLQLGHALFHELQSPTPTTPLYAETAAHMLAVHLLHRYALPATPSAPPRGLTRVHLQRVYAFVEAFLAADLSLALLAEQVHLSPYHFARMFRQTTGESPHQFVLRQRLQHAQRLLHTTDTPLVDVAAMSGFTTQSAMTTVFKQRLGVTPRAYRRLVQ